MLISTPERRKHLDCAREEIRHYQKVIPDSSYYERKLRALWERARHTRAYAHLGDFSPAALRALPVTAKDQLKAAPWEYVTTGLETAAKYYETTGTTGRVTPTPRLAEDVIWNTVSVAEAWRDILPEDDRGLVLLPSDIVPVADLVAGVYEYLGRPYSRAYPFTAGICDWDRLAGLWANLRPTTLFVAPGVALQLTRLLRQRGAIAELAEPVRAIMLLGEVNTAPLRERLSRWWAARAYDASYGSTETGTLAASCHAGSQHLLTSAHYVELLTEDGLRSLTEARRGRLVVTPLNLFARPLLRLDTGDEVAVAQGCTCGNATPVVTVAGRASDTIEVRGVRLSPRRVEEVVYAATGATGYLIEVSPTGDYARLLLERDVEWDRGAESSACASLQWSSRRALGLSWDGVTFVNSLPAATKSGASRKSWKRSNLHVLETPR